MSLATKLLSASGGGVDKLYVDDVFSAYTYTGNGATQTINNGIDLAGKGGMVWIKDRQAVASHFLEDTVRGAGALLQTNSTAAQATGYGGSFGSSGFTLAHPQINTNASFFASWTFRKAKKFFDVVTYTGNGVNVRRISHSLGADCRFAIVKRTDTTSNWKVTTSDGTFERRLCLNLTDAADSTAALANGYITMDSQRASNIALIQNTDMAAVNAVGGTYVAYLFAHDTSADGIVQCGSFTSNGSGGASVTLGWEPQYVMVKASSTTGNWKVADTSRQMDSGGICKVLAPNAPGAETNEYFVEPTATGFNMPNSVSVAGTTFIYLAIRRPNKPPTVGTQVYNAIARTGTGAAATVTGVGFAPDLVMPQARSNIQGAWWFDRLRGATKTLISHVPDAEASSEGVKSFDMNGVGLGTNFGANGAGWTYINHFFKRAPGVFDEVCYTGTGVAKTEAHGLGVAPELIIVKNRTTALDWAVYHAATGAGNFLYLNATNTVNPGTTYWNNTAPTASVFSVGSANHTNQSTATFVAYLFATKAGISKVGSYTGNGSSQTIDAGFTTGACFVMIKRTDSTGDWYVWDTVRGLAAGNDPHLSLNTTAAEVTTNDSLDPASVGFIVNQLAATNINVNAASYIYLAFA